MIASDLRPPKKEAVMGQTISTQHPAVVLRSRYRQLRALLAVAMIAVVGLTAAVVILAIDDDRESGLTPASQVSASNPAAATRSDGGPEETALAATLGSNPAVSGPDESRTAAAIGGDSGSTSTGGPNESVVANAISGR
jgi:hypothetical protein